MPTVRKPRPITGHARPDPDDVLASSRAERSMEIVETMWVDTERQRAILKEIRSYMRTCKATRRRKGASITGRRLSQYSQAGKSAIAQRLIVELEQEAIAAGEQPNPYRVIHINIDQRMSLKMLYMEILNRLADDFTDQPGLKGLPATPHPSAAIKGKTTDTIKTLEQRVEEWVGKLGVELVIVDEIQRLVTRPDEEIDPRDPTSFLTKDAIDVTEKLQAFLDRGVVPLFFIGNEHSPKFFTLNKYFAARLHKPLKLLPLNIKKTADRLRFQEFCLAYDDELVRRNAISVPTCLRKPEILSALITASGGHIGRAARIIQVALPAALARGAVTLEPYDLSNAVRDYAKDLGWVGLDPFSVVPDPIAISPVVDVSESDDAA